MAAWIGWGVLGSYAAVSVARHVMARRAWKPPAIGVEPDVVVLQPILSGDPYLAEQLAANLANHPTARFRWLVDQADHEGRRVASELAEGLERVEVRVYEAAPAASNPKLYKLARAVDAADVLVAVLDDDTVLPPGTLARAATLLADADLVTGIPYYLPDGGVWSRLVAAFVNGNALVTYLPMSLVGPPVSINGMFYLTTTAALERAGGFAAIEDRVCDDYEVARAYRRAGLRIVQASLPHPLRTTVPDAASYARIMRRWLVFSLRLLRDEADPALLALVVAPGIAPAAAIACAVAARRPSLAVATLAALAAKAVATARLRRDLIGTPTAAADLGLEVVLGPAPARTSPRRGRRRRTHHVARQAHAHRPRRPGRAVRAWEADGSAITTDAPDRVVWISGRSSAAHAALSPGTSRADRPRRAVRVRARPRRLPVPTRRGAVDEGRHRARVGAQHGPVRSPALAPRDARGRSRRGSHRSWPTPPTGCSSSAAASGLRAAGDAACGSCRAPACRVRVVALGPVCAAPTDGLDLYVAQARPT